MHVFVHVSALPGFLAYVIIISFACSLKLLIKNMMLGSTWSGKSCSSLICIISKPFWIVAYPTKSGPYFTSLMALGVLYDHVCYCVISSDTVWPVMRHNMPEIHFLLPLDKSNMITPACHYLM